MDVPRFNRNETCALSLKQKDKAVESDEMLDRCRKEAEER